MDYLCFHAWFSIQFSPSFQEISLTSGFLLTMSNKRKEWNPRGLQENPTEGGKGESPDSRRYYTTHKESIGQQATGDQESLSIHLVCHRPQTQHRYYLERASKITPAIQVIVVSTSTPTSTPTTTTTPRDSIVREAYGEPYSWRTIRL